MTPREVEECSEAVEELFTSVLIKSYSLEPEDGVMFSFPTEVGLEASSDIPIHASIQQCVYIGNERRTNGDDKLFLSGLVRNFRVIVRPLERYKTAHVYVELANPPRQFLS